MKTKRRRKSPDRAGAVSYGPDRNERFVLRKCAVYLDRLLETYLFADRETIKLLAWVMGPKMTDLGQILLKRMGTKEKQKYETDIEEDILDPEEAPDSICRILRQSGKKRTRLFITDLREVLERRYKALAYAGRSDTEKKLDVLVKMFCLRRQRISLWESALRSHHAKSSFNPEEINRMAIRYPVSAAIIDLSIRKALETSTSGQAAFKKAVTMNLDAYLTLINDGVKPKSKEIIEDNYSLDGLNIEGNLPAIMENLKEFDHCLRRSDRHAVRNFNLLFYGPPGAGKSELARFVAGHLERELVVSRASDVISPYVGETEQNISRVFADAEAAEAVLVIDEVDSFLFNRISAVRSWEISQTNEFLTQMERFQGILICTTNRFEDLDQASVRRFNYKIGFRCLKPEGNIIFYRKLLSPLTSAPLKKEWREMIENIDNLMPGDFRIVRDRFAIFPQERVTHGMMLQALQEESRIKKLQEGKKPFGFIQRN